MDRPEDAITAATHSHRLATLSSALTSLIGSATTVEELQWGCGVLSMCPIVEHHHTTSHVVSPPSIALTKGFYTAVRDAVQQLVRVEAAHPQLAVWASSVLTTISNAEKNNGDYVPLTGDHYFEEAAPLARLRQASAVTVNSAYAQAELRSVCEMMLRGGLVLPYPTKGELLSALLTVAAMVATQETLCIISPVIIWMFNESGMLVDVSLGEIAELRAQFVAMARLATTSKAVEALSSLYSQLLRDAKPGVMALLFGETAVGDALHSMVRYATSQGAIEAFATLVTHIVSAVRTSEHSSCMHNTTNERLFPSLQVLFANSRMVMDVAMLLFRATTPKTVEAVATMAHTMISNKIAWPLNFLVQYRRGLVTMATHATTAESVQGVSNAIQAMSRVIDGCHDICAELRTALKNRVMSTNVRDAILTMKPYATTPSSHYSMASALYMYCGNRNTSLLLELLFKPQETNIIQNWLSHKVIKGAPSGKGGAAPFAVRAVN
jgi:hypothetical protein